MVAVNITERIRVREELLHFIWRYKLLKPGEYKAVSGAKIKIIYPGELNKNSGPDFFNAKLEVDGVTLAGNIEIHVKTSDWLKHGHTKDAAYNNIILHAVYEHDMSLSQNSDFNVEVLEMKDYLNKAIIEKYEAFMASKNDLPCAPQVKNINPLKLSAWLQRMLVERLEHKTAYIKHVFESCGNDYSHCFYMLLARNFGFKINSEPFELLAKQLPLGILLRHKENLLQLEALLFGTAGMLEEPFEDRYLRRLQNEFEFLKNKYRLKPLEARLWKFMRMRPANFPTVRLWQFAMLVHKSPDIFSDPFKYRKTEDLTKGISHEPGEYWSTHYRPGGVEVKKVSSMGENSVQNIAINTMAPFLFFYGKQTGNDDFIEAALDCFENIPFEDNSKTRIYTEKGLRFVNSGESQGLINLHDNYCVVRRCLGCSIASELLSNSA